MILGKVNVNYKVTDIEIKGELSGSNLYNTLIDLATKKGLILVENKLAYAEDIRANYRDGELYIPVFSCKEITEGDITAHYDNKIEKILIHTFKDGYKLNEIYIIPNIQIPEAYRLKISGMKLSRDIEEKDTNARDLFYKYIASSYGYEDIDMDLFDYVKVQKQYAKASEKKLLKQKGLEFYGDYIDMEYRDARNWKLVELQRKFTDEELMIDMTFGLKRLIFELELYTRLNDKVYWENWTLGTLDNLLNDKIDYLKYKEKGIYLIFKKRWIRG